MLIYLSIKNYALIEDTLLEFSSGLNVLTGETGAGKTIVMEALGLTLGDKASAQQVRKGTARLSVAAGFKAGSCRLKKVLKELELVSENQQQEEIVIRREVDASGRSRGFINDNPVNLGTLIRVGEFLVYSHGQHEHQLLLKPSEQRDVLDAFGHLDKQREAVSSSYAHWQGLVSEKEALSLSEQERAQRIDLYRFQKQELETAGPKPEEEEELDRLLPQLKNAERLKNLAQEAVSVLRRQEASVTEDVQRVQKNVESLQELGADLGETADMVQQALVNLEESAQRLDAFLGQIDLDPQRLDDTLARLDLLSRLKKKYGPTLGEVIGYRQKVAQELDRLENLEGKSQDMSEKVHQAEKTYKEHAGALSRARKSTAKKLCDQVQKEFQEVGFPQARFDVTVDKYPEGKLTGAGADFVQFYFTPNPGEGRAPLASVASGGELSRVMLALKSVLAKTDDVPVLIFDEIDAGVGGVMGMAVGRKLSKLGKTHQVICITHLATIAACSEAHFSVEKHVKKDRTYTKAHQLSEEDRVKEIARMFGSMNKKKDDSVSLQHARELLNSVRN